MRATPARTRIHTDRFEGDWAIDKESRNNAAVNPTLANQANGTSYQYPSSNCVTPMPHYVPRFIDLEWLIGAAAIIMELLDPGSRRKQRHDAFVDEVHETIDLNDYLPTSYDDMRDWRHVVGSTGRAARS